MERFVLGFQRLSNEGLASLNFSMGPLAYRLRDVSAVGKPGFFEAVCRAAQRHHTRLRIDL